MQNASDKQAKENIAWKAKIDSAASTAETRLVLSILVEGPAGGGGGGAHACTTNQRKPAGSRKC